jgi:large subunit ribosomal protein L25
VSIEGLEVGSQIHASDLDLPAGSTLAIPEEWLIVNIVAAPTAEEVEAELEEAEAEAGIEHDVSDEDAAAAAAEGDSADGESGEGESAGGDSEEE